MTDNPVPYIISLYYLQTVVNRIEHPALVIDQQYRVIMTNPKLMGIARKINDGRPFLYCYEITHNLSKPCSGKLNPCPVLSVLK
jgi:hypothetical protein